MSKKYPERDWFDINDTGWPTKNKPVETEKEQLVLALQLALNALQFYKDNTVYYYQTGLSDFGTECSDVAEITINKISQMQLEVYKK